MAEEGPAPAGPLHVLPMFVVEGPAPAAVEPDGDAAVVPAGAGSDVG